MPIITPFSRQNSSNYFHPSEFNDVPYYDPPPFGTTKHNLGLTCVNDFRYFQHQRHILPLSTLCKMVIHIHVQHWGNRLNLPTLCCIRNLNLPAIQKNEILLEFLCCEKHTFTDYNPAKHLYHKLYTLPQSFTFLTDQYFDVPTPLTTDRFFSKTILFYLYLKYFLTKYGQSSFQDRFSNVNDSHTFLNTLLERSCTINTSECPDMPLIIDRHVFYCKSKDFMVNIDLVKRRTSAGRYNWDYFCPQWKELHLQNNVTIAFA